MSKTNPNDAAYAFGQFADENGNLYGGETGLTKRELIAAMAMQGLLSHGYTTISAAEMATQAADYLIEELNKNR